MSFYRFSENIRKLKPWHHTWLHAKQARKQYIWKAEKSNYFYGPLLKIFISLLLSSSVQYKMIKMLFNHWSCFHFVKNAWLYCAMRQETTNIFLNFLFSIVYVFFAESHFIVVADAVFFLLIILTVIWFEFGNKVIIINVLLSMVFRERVRACLGKIVILDHIRMRICLGVFWVKFELTATCQSRV